MFIVVTGTLLAGFTFVGPFPSVSDATHFIATKNLEDVAEVVPLTSEQEYQEKK